MRMFRETHFVLQKITNPQSKHFGVQGIRKELCGTVEVWITESFPTFFLEIKGVNFLQKRTEKCKSLGSLKNKVLKNLNDHGCHKIQVLVDEGMSVCLIYASKHKTTPNCTEYKAKWFCNATMHHSKL